MPKLLKYGTHRRAIHKSGAHILVRIVFGGLRAVFG